MLILMDLTTYRYAGSGQNGRLAGPSYKIPYSPLSRSEPAMREGVAVHGDDGAIAPAADALEDKDHFAIAGDAGRVHGRRQGDFLTRRDVDQRHVVDSPLALRAIEVV